MAELLNTLQELVFTLIKLVGELGSLALHWWLVILWFAWWLWGVNWHTAWPILARGAWMPLALLVILAAFAWSQIAPGSRVFLSILDMPNFWWQLGASSALVGSALLCGWLQGIMGWTPADVEVDPPAHVEHDHAHH